MAIVNGFAGLRVLEEGISLAPSLPDSWNGFRFKFVYKKKLIKVTIDKEKVTVELLEGSSQNIKIFSKEYTLTKGEKTTVKMED